MRSVKQACLVFGICVLSVGLCATATAQTPVFVADFEDGEVNPGKIGGIVNTDPYPSAQPELVSDGEYGWQVKDSYHTSGYAEIVNWDDYSGRNSIVVINKFLRVDIEHELQADSEYTFSYWIMILPGMPLTIDNRIVCKDQTNGHLFINSGNPNYITLPAHNTWYQRTVTFSTAGYVPAVTNPDGTIDLRFGAIFSGPTPGAGIITDFWELSYVPASTEAITYWQPTGGLSPTTWWDESNWSAGVPGANSHVLTQLWTPWPIVTWTVDPVNILTTGWHANVRSSLIVADSGMLDVLSFIRLGNDTGSAGFLDIAGGIVDTPLLQLSLHEASGGFINLDAGSLYTDSLGLRAGVTGSQANIDLERDAALYIGGDHVSNGDVASWIGSGVLSAAEGRGTLTYSYDGVDDLTVVEADQTPLAKNGSFEAPAVAVAASEMRMAAPYYPLDLNLASSSWSWNAQCGVATTGCPTLGAATPVGNQAGVLFDNGTPDNAGQIHQDIIDIWEDGQTYTFSWLEAVGAMSAGVARNPDFSVQLHEFLAIGGLGEGFILSQTDGINNPSLTPMSVDFVVDLKLDDGDPNNDVVGYRLLLDARGLEGPNGAGDFGFVIVDAVYVTPYVEVGPFQDVTDVTGLSAYTSGAADVSVAWGDFNSDGFVDLYIGGADPASAGLFQNQGGVSFSPLPDAGPGANHPGLFLDYDNDGLLDLYTTQAGAHASHNYGGGSFTRIPGGLGGDLVVSQSETGTWADFDGDGYLDLYRVGWQPGQMTTPDDALYLSDAGTWLDLAWQGPAGDERYGRSATCADFDEDGDIDVYVSNYGLQQNYLWTNDGAGNLTDVAEDYGVDGDDVPWWFEEQQVWLYGGFTIGSAWGDLDNDGHLDLVVGNFSHEPLNGQDPPHFYRNMGPPTWHFEEMTVQVAMPWVESHASPTLGDFDNDGDLDLFITAVSGAYTGQQSTLLQNDGDWNFTDVSDDYGLGLASDLTNFMAAWADYDNDGDLDLLAARKLYQNNLDNGNHWLKVHVAGDGRAISRDAVGTQVRIDLGGGEILTRQVETATGWGNQNDPTLHFGLGDVAGPVDLTILWPDGTSDTVVGVDVDQLICVANNPAVTDFGFEAPNAPDGADLRQGVVNLNAMTGLRWVFSNLCGVADDPNLYLAGVLPDQEQAGILFENGSEGNAGQIHQDLLCGWRDGETYTINWSEAMGWTSELVTTTPDFSVQLHELLVDGGFGEGFILNTTSGISNTALAPMSAEFTVDLKLGDGDPGNDVAGYRLLLDARGLAGDDPEAHMNFGFVVVDSVSIIPDLPLCAGDMNCDGVVGFDDIDPFVLALGGQAGYEAQYPDCPWLNADCNGDGTVSFDDIDPFVARIGTVCP